MPTVTIFDPPLCCRTGICGPDVDPVLVRFAGDLEWLKSRGVEIRRINLAQEPGRFAGHPAIRSLLERSGTAAMPAILVDDALVMNGRYPRRDELAAMTGLTPRPQDAVAKPPEVTMSPCCSGNSATLKKTPGCC